MTTTKPYTVYRYPITVAKLVIEATSDADAIARACTVETPLGAAERVVTVTVDGAEFAEWAEADKVFLVLRPDGSEQWYAADGKTPLPPITTEQARRTACSHNTMVPHDGDGPAFAWKCADCGYVYGKPNNSR